MSPTSVNHAWMPSSPCDASCLSTGGRSVRLPVLILRWVLVVAVLVVFPVLLAARMLPVGIRRRVVKGGARSLLLALGIRIDLTAASRASVADTTAGTLIVSNHVSWTDILVLAALFPARFVARGDLLDWPILGTVARLVRVVPIDRGRLRALPGTVADVASLLRAGSTVVAFPEGTTWCGKAAGSMRPALFQSAIDSGAPVRPVAMSYVDGTGSPTTATAFVGDESMGASVNRIIGLRGLRVQVRVSDVLADRSDRRVMASVSERIVHGRDRAAADRLLVRAAFDLEFPISV